MLLTKAKPLKEQLFPRNRMVEVLDVLLETCLPGCDY